MYKSYSIELWGRGNGKERSGGQDLANKVVMVNEYLGGIVEMMIQLCEEIYGYLKRGNNFRQCCTMAFVK